MRRPATITLLALGIAVASLCGTSAGYGKTVSRWHSWESVIGFEARGCDEAFEAKKTLPKGARQIKIRQPSIGEALKGKNGQEVLMVSSVRARRLGGGQTLITWQATPRLSCPEHLSRPIRPLEVTWNISESYEEYATRQAAQEREYHERLSAWEAARDEWMDMWGTELGRTPVRTELADLNLKFLRRQRIAPPSVSAPCDYLLCEAKHALFRTLKSHYGLTTDSAACHQLTAREVHCYFQGLTEADVKEGNVAGHSGDAYVRKFSYGFDVQVVSFHLT